MLNCTWTFYSMYGNKMKALIKDFIMEESWNCEWDYFNIYDGPDQQSRLLGKLNLLKCPMLSSIHKKIYIIIYVANINHTFIYHIQRLSLFMRKDTYSIQMESKEEERCRQSCISQRVGRGACPCAAGDEITAGCWRGGGHSIGCPFLLHTPTSAKPALVALASVMPLFRFFHLAHKQA